ncbi:unnamed protein product [Rotaria magnacalcarata]|uniref:TIR domain-containing protein n=2 Tax=Rotaria magnacalcarata TaxID=392030 RepID=A0A815YT83_9BILA|nr:unnamed protein product [Rotaria magnacalcarata]CAF2175699.1 unnamed protein product [Rotaria magnacalcarata]CAF3821100.1 unnamed protein product [Rotaria magnacalcarata]CAF3832479.1 unnamed protein product [Rotaria magnacalcarata]CAF3858427.1 unnamed protein product [Rotaria magnacalcarata]
MSKSSSLRSVFLHYNYVYLDLSTYTSIASNLISLDLLISGSPNTVSVYSILPIPRVCHRIRYLHAIIKHEIPSENNNVKALKNMNTIVDQHCTIIREQEATITIEQLKTSFDVFVSEIKKSDSSIINVTLLKQIVPILTQLLSKNNQLADSELMKHPLFTTLRDSVLIDYLRQRQNKDAVYEFLPDLASLYAKIGYRINNMNALLFKQLLFYPPLIDEIVNCLNDIMTNEKYLDDGILLSSIHFLLMAFINFEKKQSTTNDYSSIRSLTKAVVACLCSSYAVEMIKQLEHNFSQKLTQAHLLFLNTCPLYLRWYGSYQALENFQISKNLLNPFTEWIISCPSDLIVNCSKQVGDMIRHLTSILLRSVPSDNSDASIEQFNDDYYKFLIHWTSLLSSMLKCSSNDSTIISIKRFIVQHLYDLTLNANLLNFMKTIPNLIPMLLQMTDIEQDETQLNIYRCLGKLMTEADIKAMETSNFVQHDQVKVELIKQNILPLLIRCIIETKFDPINVQKVVLKILLALSFNDDASTILKQNKDFMSQVRNLANNTNVDKSNLQRAAEGLLWKLEKEAVAITKSASSRSFKYDVMISYSHSDHPLCYQIHERLVQDGFNVWIDRDQMHGAPMIAMADAVENSEFVLLCMSDTYKQSVYCQSEAHYAFERRCRLIPLIMKSHYKPDGWLGIMVSGKIYVDFMKNEFKLAYNKLKTEIDQYRQQNLNHSMVKSKGKNPQDVSSTISKSVQKPSKSTERPAIVNLPCCIIQWTNNHVQSFFLTNELDNTMLLLCLRLDGCCLLQLYEMCMMNRESMYQSLKAELADVHHTTLPISDYLTFLHQIKRYVPLTPVVTKTNQSPFPPSTVCNLM